MCGDDTSLTERIAQKLEVRLLEEALSGTLGVRAVSDDNIELVLALLEELETIANVDLDVGVLEANAHARKVLLGDTDDSLRNNKPHFLNTRHKDAGIFCWFTSSMSHRVASSTVSCLTTSRRTPPSPPPMTRTFLGLGWEFMARWVIISW